MVLTPRCRFAVGPGPPEIQALHPLLLLRLPWCCCCASGASSKLAWKCHLIILKTSQQSHGGRGQSAGTLLKSSGSGKRRRNEAVFEAIKLFPKMTGLLLMVRSLKSCYWPRPVEGQERTGFRPPEGVVWDGGRRGTQPAKQLTGGATAPPAPAEPHSAGQLGSPPLEGGPILLFL